MKLKIDFNIYCISDQNSRQSNALEWSRKELERGVGKGAIDGALAREVLERGQVLADSGSIAADDGAAE